MLFTTKNLVLSAAIGVSLLLKTVTLNTHAHTGISVRVASPSETLMNMDFLYLGQHRLINSPHYAAEIYLHRSNDKACKGLLYLLPMPDNSEAVTLLESPPGFKSQDSFYLLNNSLHSTFPAYRLWLDRLYSRASNLLGLVYEAPLVVGVSVTSTCLKVRNLPWQQIIQEIRSV